MAARSEALTAVTRFGLGPSPGDLARARPDPRGWVVAQTRADPVPEEMLGLTDGTEAVRMIHRHQAMVREARARTRRTERGTPERAAALEAAKSAFSERSRDLQATIRAETSARVNAALRTTTPLVERLVAFWANHFALDSSGRVRRALVGHHERAAVRPFVLGRFEDMARAAILHPAMLDYLDNTGNVGPNSRFGRRRGRGINENLAREAMELHTLGVDGGYTQDDVIALARMLTGWTGGLHGAAERPFVADRHEPGEKRLLGKTYADTGERQALEAIGDLARHPATARHLSAKLARHFLPDEVSPALVDRLSRTFLDTDGDLAAVTRALVTSEEAWTAPPAAFVPPNGFMISALRTFQVAPAGGLLGRGAHALGQRLWQPPDVAGFPDEDDSWLGGDHLLERLDWAIWFADTTPEVAKAPRPERFAADLLGPDLDPYLETALARAEDRTQGFALMLMSAQWQRR